MHQRQEASLLRTQDNKKIIDGLCSMWVYLHTTKNYTIVHKTNVGYALMKDNRRKKYLCGYMLVRENIVSDIIAQ